jgi:DNA-binding NarL/FixJ family response regulator
MRIHRGAAPNPPPNGARETRIRLVLVEDHAVLRNGLKALLELEADVEIVGEFDCVESCVDCIRRAQPDVVVTDLALPGASGIELIGEIQSLSPRSRILALTVQDGREYIRAAFRAGADGYVLKEADYAELLRAIRTVSMGGRFLCSATASKVLLGYLSGDPQLSPPTPIASITDREREVLTHIAQGHPNKAIARELGLSPKTIEKHRSNLMRKLQLHNAAAITMYAIRNGLAGTDLPEVRAPAAAPLSYGRSSDL